MTDYILRNPLLPGNFCGSDKWLDQIAATKQPQPDSSKHKGNAQAVFFLIPGSFLVGRIYKCWLRLCCSRYLHFYTPEAMARCCKLYVRSAVRFRQSRRSADSLRAGVRPASRRHGGSDRSSPLYSYQLR